MNFDKLIDGLLKEDKELSRQDRIHLLKKDKDLLRIPQLTFKVVTLTLCRGIDVDSIEEIQAPDLSLACIEARNEFIREVQAEAGPEEAEDVDDFIRDWVEQPEYNLEMDIGGFSTGEESAIIVIGARSRFFNKNIEKNIEKILDNIDL